ncbi:MAG: PLP-dependent aminotransferase family protein [Proteobacteria bacterium]|nr:PLP-dependent aminotransferase family protein [Pseudomonadota bacterium]
MTIQLQFPETGDSPKYLSIANSIQAAIAEGRLAPGDPLPTHRDLADQLGVTVGTVTRGYAEAARRGLVRGERGRGTYAMQNRQGFAELGHDNGLVDLGLAATTHPLGASLGATLVELSGREGLQELLTRHESRGLPRHREAGVRWAAEYGYTAQADNVLVCAGAQHAVLTTMAAMFSPGDRVAVECLTYPMIKPMAKRLSLQLVPIPMDQQGLLPDALNKACARDKIRGLYTMPSCQNPTLARMPEFRRFELAEVCRRHGLTIVEDDVYALAVGSSLPPLSMLAPELGFFIAATSKVLCDGLRVAFLCAPSSAVRRLESAIEMTAWKAAGLMAEITSTWINDGTATRIVEANRTEAAARNDLALELLGQETFRGQATGSFIWVPMPRGWRSVEFAETAAERGVIVAHSEHFAVAGLGVEQGVRVSLSGVRDRVVLGRGLTTLAEMLRL